MEKKPGRPAKTEKASEQNMDIVMQELKLIQEKIDSIKIKIDADQLYIAQLSNHYRDIDTKRHLICERIYKFFYAYTISIFIFSVANLLQIICYIIT